MFPVKIRLVCRRSSNPFCHLCRPKSLLFPSRISSATVSIHIVPHLLHPARPLPSSTLTLSAIPIILHLHRSSIFILLRLCCGPHHIIFHLPVYFSAVFVYLLRSDLILALRCSSLHFLLHFAPHYFSHYLLCCSHYSFLFSFGTDILSIRDVLDPF